MMNQTALFGFHHEPAVIYGGEKTLDAQLQAKLSRQGLELIKAQKELALYKSANSHLDASCKELNQRLASQTWQITRLTNALKELHASKSTGSSNMTKETWRRLLQLCHPDKHSNSEAATLATQWLNKNKPT